MKLRTVNDVVEEVRHHVGNHEVADGEGLVPIGGGGLCGWVTAEAGLVGEAAGTGTLVAVEVPHDVELRLDVHEVPKRLTRG